MPEKPDKEIKSSNIVRSYDEISNVEFKNALINIECTKNTYNIDNEFLKNDDDK